MKYILYKGQRELLTLLDRCNPSVGGGRDVGGLVVWGDEG